MLFNVSVTLNSNWYNIICNVKTVNFENIQLFHWPCRQFKVESYVYRKIVLHFFLWRLQNFLERFHFFRTCSVILGKVPWNQNIINDWWKIKLFSDTTADVIVGFFVVLPLTLKHIHEYFLIISHWANTGLSALSRSNDACDLNMTEHLLWISSFIMLTGK